MGKRVCIIVQEYYPGDVRVKKEVDALQRKGYEVCILSLYHPGLEKHEIVDDTMIYRGGLSKKRRGILRYLMEYAAFFLFSFVWLNLVDMKNRIDVVQVCNLPDFLVFAAIIQKLKGRRVVLDMHEIMPEFFMSKYGVGEESWIVRMLRLVERKSLGFADGIMTVNESIKQIFETRAVPGEHVEVVMNTLDGSLTSSMTRKAHKGFNCVYHGTVTKLYALDIAILGFSIAAGNATDMKFHIFGNGPELERLRRLARDVNVGGKVVFHGGVSHVEMLERLREMDLGVLAFEKDVFLNLSFSNKLAEYIFLGIPVVTTDLDSVKYYFGDNHILYYESGNAEDLSRKILYAYNNRERGKAMSEAALERSKDIDWSIMAERYLQVIGG
jgi:glycosyltransferase involved in cell wall biosynthesis